MILLNFLIFDDPLLGFFFANEFIFLMLPNNSNG